MCLNSARRRAAAPSGGAGGAVEMFWFQFGLIVLVTLISLLNERPGQRSRVARPRVRGRTPVAVRDAMSPGPMRHKGRLRARTGSPVGLRRVWRQQGKLRVQGWKTEQLFLK